MGTYQVTTDQGTFNVQTDDSAGGGQLTPQTNPVAQAYLNSQTPPTGVGINTMQSIQKASEVPSAVYQSMQEKQAGIQPTQTQSLGEQAGKEVLGAATSIAKDASLGDLLTEAQRLRNENYAVAHQGGLAGGKWQKWLSEQTAQNPLIGGMEKMFNPDAVKAASNFDSSTNGLLSQGQQVFAGQIGTGNASTRIMSTVLDLLHGEFGDRSDSPESMMGRTEGSQQTIYLIQKFGQQYMSKLAQMGITPANIDSLPPTAIDKIASDFGQTVKQGMQNYQVTPHDKEIIRARTDYINEPLKEITQKKSGNSVSYKDVLSGIK